jgi:hypothetical protein
LKRVIKNCHNNTAYVIHGCNSFLLGVMKSPALKKTPRAWELEIVDDLGIWSSRHSRAWWKFYHIVQTALTVLWALTTLIAPTAATALRHVGAVSVGRTFLRALFVFLSHAIFPIINKQNWQWKYMEGRFYT